MTKEKLITIVNERGLLAVEDLKEFFDSNVCIPKGANRHPYAEVLHEWIENIALKLEFFDGEYWRYLHAIPIHATINTEYRIKPSEPEFEYAWYRIKDGFPVIHLNWMTEDEAKNCRPTSYIHYILKETKRVRQ